MKEFRDSKEALDYKMGYPCGSIVKKIAAIKRQVKDREIRKQIYKSCFKNEDIKLARFYKIKFTLN